MRVLILLCVAISVRAEVVQPQVVQPGVQPGGQPQQQGYPPSGGSNGFPIFDNNFFVSKPDSQQPTTAGGRSLGKDADINTEIQERITEECRPQIEKGMKYFRKCFDEKKKAEIAKFKSGKEDVEKRQQMPLSNVPSAVEDFKRPPSSEED